MNKMLAFPRMLCFRSAFSHCKQLCRNTAVQRDNLRYMSLIRTPPVPPVITGTVVSKDKARDFMAVFPDVVRDLTDTGLNTDIPGVTKWLAKLLQYNVPSGKKVRGLSLIFSYKMLSSESELTDENLRLSYIMGWCIEIFETFQLVLDDIMDNSTMRRGKLSWYRHSDVGLMAINDGILLDQTIYQLLKKYFREKPYYTHILEHFHDITMKTAIGQCLDMSIAHSFKSNKFEKYTMENYKAIVKYKTALYSYFLPMCLAMRMTNINDPEIFRQAKTISLELGHLLQFQNDYLDCYGDPEVTGKIGNDIEDGKCSWLAVVALQNANPQQMKIMEENFGINDPAKIAVIKNLYEELKLPNIFQLHEEECFNIITTHIQQVSNGLLQDLFFKYLETFKRIS